MSAKLQKFEDNTKLIMCGNILFVLNEYLNMIVDSRLIRDNHLDRVFILVFIYSGSEDILLTYKMGELQVSQDVFLSRSSFIGTDPRTRL